MFVTGGGVDFYEGVAVQHCPWAGTDDQLVFCFLTVRLWTEGELVRVQHTCYSMRNMKEHR